MRMKIYADLIRNYKNQRIKSLWDNKVKKQLKKVAEQRTKYIERGLSLGTSKDILLYLWDTQATKQMGYALIYGAIIEWFIMKIF